MFATKMMPYSKQTEALLGMSFPIQVEVERRGTRSYLVKWGRVKSKPKCEILFSKIL